MGKLAAIDYGGIGTLTLGVAAMITAVSVAIMNTKSNKKVEAKVDTITLTVVEIDRAVNGRPGEAATVSEQIDEAAGVLPLLRERIVPQIDRIEAAVRSGNDELPGIDWS